MKENDIVAFKEDFEFEAYNEYDNPIGMRLLPKGTQCTVVCDKGLSKGWVTVEFSDETWKEEEWGTNELLEIPVDELDLIKEI